MASFVFRIFLITCFGIQWYIFSFLPFFFQIIFRFQIYIYVCFLNDIQDTTSNRSMTFKIVYFRFLTSYFSTHKCFWKYVESGLKIADKKAWNKRRLKNYIMSPWEMLQLPTIYCYMSFLISPRIDEAQDRKKFTRKRNEINLDILNQLQCIEKKFFHVLLE